MADVVRQLKDADGNNVYPIAYAQGGVKMDLLWTNPNPTSEYSNTNEESIDLSNYNYIIIDFKFSSSGTLHTFSTFLIPTTGIVLASHFRNYVRNVTTALTGVTFGTCGYFATYGTNTQTTSNGNLIPYQIYGVKMSYIVPTTTNNILEGTTEPTSALGSNEDIYIMYENE